MRFSKLSALVALAATLSACSGDDGEAGEAGPAGEAGTDGEDGSDGASGEDGDNGSNGEDGADGVDGIDGAAGGAGPGVSVLQLNLSGLENLGPDYAYEGWIIVDDAPVSTGIFHVNSDGQQTDSTFAVDAHDLAAATTFVLTIEPVPDADPAPSDVHILAGDFDGDSSDLVVGHAAALGDDFSGAAGTFILETPTSTPADDYDQGIWWLSMPGPTASLTLPTLPAGWAYEGWVVDTSGESPVPISTGTFTDVAGADSDGPGPEAGADAGGPPYPGQDFVTPPRVLTSDHMAVISIEPVPDNSPAPFLLKPLVDTDITDVGAGVDQAMANNAGTFPTGTAIR